MKLKNTILIGSVIGATAGFILFSLKSDDVVASKTTPQPFKAYNLTPNNEIPYFPESSYPISVSHGSYLKTYSNLNDMYKEAEIIAEVKITQQQTEQRETFVKTVSQAEVQQIFKGSADIKTIPIAELGGPVDLSKMADKFKDKPGNLKEPAQGIVERALDGSPVMKQGNTYIVLLEKNKNGTYSPKGTVQGKLKIDKSNKVVFTVDPQYINDQLYFLQRQFAGKAKSEVVAAIKALQ